MSTSARLLLTLWAGVLLLGGCSNRQLVSTWSAEGIQIDGHSNDWDKIPRTIMSDPQASFAVCNDSTNLYLLLHVNDRRVSRMLQTGGITVWLDSAAKKKKTFGIFYRGRPSYIVPRDDDDSTASDFGQRDPGPPAQEELAVLYGSARNRIPVRAGESGVPAAGFFAEGGGATYELSVALSVADAEFAIDAQPGSRLSVGIEFGAPPRDHMGKMDRDRGADGQRRGGPDGGQGGDDGPPFGRHGGGMGGGGGGMGGGMGGDGMPGGGRGGHGRGPGREQERASTETEVWLNLALAPSASTSR